MESDVLINVIWLKWTKFQEYRNTEYIARFLKLSKKYPNVTKLKSSKTQCSDKELRRDQFSYLFSGRVWVIFSYPK